MATKKTLDQVAGVDYLDILQQCEKVAKVQSINLSVEQRLSTGLLCLDGILGGGITAGMYTFFGPEQSAKTTAAVTLMGASVGQDVGQCILWDAENSTGSSMDYVSNIFNTLNVKAKAETIFGVKKDGKWVIRPLVYYRDEGEAETFFNFVAALLRRLPDKRYEDGDWWYIYPRTKENISGLKDVADASKSRQNDAIYVKAESGSLQAIIVVDSYPGLMPASMDEDDPSGSIAQKARAMSSGIDRVKGRLRSKRVALVGINQLRTNPLDRYNPEYEPAGQALKYFSDCRLRFMPLALSGVPFHPKGAMGKNGYTDSRVEEEKSVDGEGVDRYRYIRVRSIKNKLSLPNRETWLRIWIEDSNGNAQGYDPVWDTFYALFLTGQVTGKRSAITLAPHGREPFKKTINWNQFKQLIIGTKEQKAEVWQHLGSSKVVDLRTYVRKQLLSEKYEALYVEWRNSSAKALED